jgi:hypothetical protein
MKKALNLIPWNFCNVGLGFFYKKIPMVFLNGPNPPMVFNNIWW